jgi:hypothetical protein
MKIPISFPEQEPEPEPVEIQVRFERDCEMLEWFERVWHILNAYQLRQRGERQLRMSTRAMQLALGFRLAAGADGPAALARNCGVTKQAMNNCLRHFIEQLQLTPLPGQRRAEARKHMAEARLNQLKVKQ